MSSNHETEVASGERFAFGANWKSFLQKLDETRIVAAEKALIDRLGRDRFDGETVLDIGCGSGIHSLAFRRLGAAVHSFDYDRDSVECTLFLREKYFPNDPEWTVSEGSVLDKGLMESLDKSSLVYSWGVLHHTGSMWEAVSNASIPVEDGGIFYIGLYRDRGKISEVWRIIKKTYCSSFLGKALILSIFIPYYLLRGIAEDLLKFKNPRKRYTNYYNARGMSKWHDWIDWLGGYPYEFTTLDKMKQFVEDFGFSLISSDTEFMVEGVFRKN